MKARAGPYGSYNNITYCTIKPYFKGVKEDEKKAWHKSLLKENKDDFNQNTVEGNKGLLTLSLLRGSPLTSKIIWR